MVKRWGVVAVVGAVVAVIALSAQVAVAASGASEKPSATEIGVSATEIRIAVIADVENAAAPGLFQGSVDGVRGVAKYLNKNGGLAGRKVVVDFIDSRLSPDEARSAMIKACEEDFAMVGTSAVFLTSDPSSAQ